VKRTLSRRAMLRGLGGVVVGLPVLECMLNGRGDALAQTGGALPKRYAIVFAGQAIGGDEFPRDRQRIGDVVYTEAGHFIAPPEPGAAWTTTTPLLPLADLKADVSIVSGLRIPWNPDGTDAEVPAGGAYRDFHGGGASPLLCGVRSTEARFTCNGATSDQIVAALHAGQTAAQSLVYRAQPSWYLAGSSYAGRQYLSYAGADDPIEAATSPRIAWQSLFQGFVPDGAGPAAVHDFTQRARASVLDLVQEKRARLVARVGAGDRVRLERHFDELRALELRVQALPPPTTATCVPPADPGADPAIGGDNAGSGADVIETTTGWSEEGTRAKLFADLIHMAFVCDLSRVATLMITTFQSHMNAYAASSSMGVPIRADLHEVGHNGDPANKGQLAVSTMLRWHVDVYAHLLAKLKATPEGAGTALDNCVVVFMPEAGHGTQLNDGVTAYATHSVEDMVLLVAGRAGGLVPGSHHAATGVHPGQVLVSCMQAAGASVDALGEVTGDYPALFGA
jgi:hypothetical protein